MVVDVSGGPEATGVRCTAGVCECVPSPFPDDHPCCFAVCDGHLLGNPVIETCDGEPCDRYPYPQGCDVERGAGRTTDYMYRPCGFADQLRFIASGEPDLATAFECAAIVGINANEEQQMTALTRAIGSLSEPGACNEGFLRDDAILVVTLITDDEDTKSPGDPGSWKQSVLAAKARNEDAVVMLGLLDDSDLPGGTCGQRADHDAKPAPVLREFVSSFRHGVAASICAEDYASFFDSVVDLVGTSCERFVPPR
jgi:hypothetical protein